MDQESKGKHNEAVQNFRDGGGLLFLRARRATARHARRTGATTLSRHHAMAETAATSIGELSSRASLPMARRGTRENSAVMCLPGASVSADSSARAERVLVIYIGRVDDGVAVLQRWLDRLRAAGCRTCGAYVTTRPLQSHV